MAPLKCFLASGVTFALLVFLPSLVHAQSSVVWKTNYYTVGGATLQEIHESFRQARPWKNKSSYDGLTDWRIDWRFRVTPAGDGCRCDSFTTQTAITITLPRWTAPTNAAPEVREAWRSFFTALSKHEAGHAQNALAAVTEMHQRVNRLPMENNCAALKKKIDEMAGRVLAEFRQRDEEFDRHRCSMLEPKTPRPHAPTHALSGRSTYFVRCVPTRQSPALSSSCLIISP